MHDTATLVRLGEPDAAQQCIAKAQRTVASHAEGADDCRLLLEALGLTTSRTVHLGRTCPNCGVFHYRRGLRWESRFCSSTCLSVRVRQQQRASDSL